MPRLARYFDSDRYAYAQLLKNLVLLGVVVGILGNALAIFVDPAFLRLYIRISGPLCAIRDRLYLAYGRSYHWLCCINAGLRHDGGPRFPFSGSFRPGCRRCHCSCLLVLDSPTRVDGERLCRADWASFLCAGSAFLFFSVRSFALVCS